jgi:DNA-binding LytR/AlgR family response regulator
MKVLIVEDEALARERLVEFVHRYDASIHVANAFDTVEETVDFLRKKPDIDLAFFDIRLSDGLSFEIFNQVSFTTPIIFTTAYDDYAVRAFKVNSIDYLLKPIDYDELVAAMGKFKNTYQKPAAVIDSDSIRRIINGMNNQYKKRFLVKFGEHLQFKTIDDIAYFFADGKTAYLVTKGNNRKYIVDHTLDELENKYLDPENFYRINRKFIVCIDAIEDVRQYINSRLKIKTTPPCTSDMIVSRDKVPSFKMWMNG